MTTNKVEIRSEVKVLCPKCRTEGKKSKVIFYPGQTIPRMKYTDGYWNESGDFVEFNAEIKLPSAYVERQATPMPRIGLGK